jgi:hypothetical protein
MTSNFNYSDLYNLNEFSFIAGSDQELIFNIYTNACALVNISGATIEWKLYRYSNPELTMLSKVGAITGSPVNQFNVKLDAIDTNGSNGKFLQIYSITDSSGSLIRPGVGIINILPYPS